MSWQNVINQKIAELTNTVNSIITGSKNIEELPEQSNIDLSLKIPVSKNNETKSLALQHLVDSIQIGGHNKIISIDGAISNINNTITIPAIAWEINNITYSKIGISEFLIALTSENTKRIDIIICDDNGEIIHIQGNETDGVAIRPIVPNNSILITQIDVTSTSVGGAENPNIGNYYIQKKYLFGYQYPQLSGSNAIINLSSQGFQQYTLINSGLVSVKGFSMSLITGNSSAEIPFEGKAIRITNKTGNTITLLHNTDVDLPFYFKNLENQTIPSGETVEFRYSKINNYFKLEEVFKSWQINTGQSVINQSNNDVKVLFSGTKNSHDFPTHTGTTAIVDYFSFTIPANTIPSECMLRLNVLITFSKSSNYKFTTLVFNSINPNINLLVYNQQITTNVSYYNSLHVNRYMRVSNGKLLSNRDYKTNLYAGVSVEHQFNVAEPNIFRFFSKLENANDNYTIEAITLEAIKITN